MTLITKIMNEQRNKEANTAHELLTNKHTNSKPWNSFKSVLSPQYSLLDAQYAEVTGGSRQPYVYEAAILRT